MKNGEYILIKPPIDWVGNVHKSGYCYEHHFIYYKYYGVIINKDQVIHHINRIKTDNRIENLKLLNINEHNKLHLNERINVNKRITNYITVICAFCGNSFNKKASIVRQKKKEGQKDFYCNRKCMSSHFGNGRPKNINK